MKSFREVVRANQVPHWPSAEERTRRPWRPLACRPVNRILVTGGTRSGKSAVAESLLPVASDPPVTYIATAEVDGDPEMERRIDQHRRRRPDGWVTVETADVAGAIRLAPGSVLVDSVGLWVAREMTAGDLWEEGDLNGLPDEAARWFEDPDRTVVVVAEQVGGAVVATDGGTRRWVDAVGEVTAALSARADRVLLVVAGRAVELPGPAAVQPAAARTPEGPVPEATGGESERLLGRHGDTMVPAGAIDMAVNVLDQRPPAHIRRALAAVDTGAYPDPGPALTAVAALTGLTVDHVLLLPGAAEAFWLLPHALRPRHAAVVHPSFTAPEAALRACDVPVTRVPRDAADGWALRPDRVPDDVDMVVIGNPNNPTGTLDNPAVIASVCRPGRVVVVDEAFMDFVVDGHSSLAGRVDLPGLVVIRSVTKMWSVPGLRAGWLVAAPELAARLRRHQQPWPVSTAAIAFIAAAADDETWRTDTADGVARRRRAMVSRLQRIAGVTVHDGAANFVLIEVAAGTVVQRGLLARGVAVRPSKFPLLPPRVLRVTVHDAPAVEALATAMETIL
ncbi:hypothetical protein BH23ACT9_BH23ACT9_06930 [soil metagenome]